MENYFKTSDSNFTLNPNHATIIFKSKFSTNYGENLRIVGNIEELGSWEPNKSIEMTTNKDTFPIWQSSTEITGPVGMEIIYKYVIEKEGNYIWENLKNNQNRKFTISNSGIFIINDEENSINSYVQKINNNESIDQLQELCDEINKATNEDTNDDEIDHFNCLSYDASHLNGSEKPFFFCINQKISSDDRIIIASAHLPFEIDKTPDDHFKIRVTDESLIYSILYGMKEKEICEVVWVGMLKNFSQFSVDDLEKINDFLRDKNIYMINVSENEYKNYWIYMNKILGDVFVACTVDIHK
jgi:hypothetical protein